MRNSKLHGSRAGTQLGLLFSCLCFTPSPSHLKTAVFRRNLCTCVLSFERSLSVCWVHMNSPVLSRESIRPGGVKVFVEIQEEFEIRQLLRTQRKRCSLVQKHPLSRNVETNPQTGLAWPLEVFIRAVTACW